MIKVRFLTAAHKLRILAAKTWLFPHLFKFILRGMRLFLLLFYTQPTNAKTDEERFKPVQGHECSFYSFHAVFTNFTHLINNNLTIQFRNSALLEVGTPGTCTAVMQ